MSEAEQAGQADEFDPENIKLYYPNVDAFVHMMLLPNWRHLPRKDVRWCRKWYLHAEAMSRLDALWRAYEALRVGDPTGMTVWWRDYADPTMSALTREGGTFADCDPRKGPEDTHSPLKMWPADHAPEVSVPDEDVLRPKAQAKPRV